MGFKDVGKGNFGIKVVYDNGKTVFTWWEDASDRDRMYDYRVASRKRRVKAGVPDHTIVKVKR